jgi:hypothetical protein
MENIVLRSAWWESRGPSTPDGDYRRLSLITSLEPDRQRGGRRLKHAYHTPTSVQPTMRRRVMKSVIAQEPSATVVMSAGNFRVAYAPIS